MVARAIVAAIALPGRLLVGRSKQPLGTAIVRHRIAADRLARRPAGQRRDHRRVARAGSVRAITHFGQLHRRGRVGRGGLAQHRQLPLVFQILPGGGRDIAEVDIVPRLQLLLAGAGFELGLEVQCLLAQRDDAVFLAPHLAAQRVDAHRQHHHQRGANRQQRQPADRTETAG